MYSATFKGRGTILYQIRGGREGGGGDESILYPLTMNNPDVHI
jgi:hypothetical protein